MMTMPNRSRWLVALSILLVGLERRPVPYMLAVAMASNVVVAGVSRQALALSASDEPIKQMYHLVLLRKGEAPGAGRLLGRLTPAARRRVHTVVDYR
jgi:hypothetical protein